MADAIHFDFRTGGGSPVEILHGELLVEPTRVVHTNTALILPEPSRHGIANGQATITDVYPTPDGENPEWVYRVTAINSVTRKKTVWLVGVPAGIVEEQFKNLPVYETSIPAGTTPAMMQSWASDAMNSAAMAEADRIAAEAAALQAANLSDGKIEELLNDPASGTWGAINHMINEGLAELPAGIAVNVLDPQYGVLADGATDDTAALVAIRNTLATLGGGTMFFPPKDYHVGGYIEVFDNLTVLGPGATLLKLDTSPNQASFVAKSNGATGYGSGGRGITFDGIRLKGTFAGNRGNGVAMHHAEDVEFRNVTFEECIITGHSADLGGCRTFRFRNCKWLGWKVSSGREFTEAIQVDYSTAATVGLDTIASSFDGLPTVDVVVEDCQFLPLTIAGVTYPAPNPIGCHTRVQGKLLEDIHFINNLVHGGHWTVGFTGSTATFHKGWIHLGYAKGIKVNGNKFVATHSAPTRVVNINAPDSAYAMSSVADAGASMIATTSIPVQDFEFLDNTFVGFNSAETTARSEPLIYLRGYSETNRAKNFNLGRTTFIGCSPASEGTYSYEGQIGVNAAYIDGLTIDRPSLQGLSQLLLSVKNKNVTVSNPSGYLTSIFFQDDDSIDFTLQNVDVKYPGGAQLLRTNGVVLNSVKLRTVAVAAGGSLGDRLLSLNGCKNIQSRDATVDNTAGSTVTTKGIWVHGSAQVGRIDQTLVKGSFAVAGVQVESNSTTVVPANTLVAV